MIIYKFGGASIASPELMKGLLPIMQEVAQPIIIVVSAIGKTTNELENIVNLAAGNNLNEAQNAAKVMKTKHLDYAFNVLNADYYKGFEQITVPYFKELDKNIIEAGMADYDYVYDQIVCLGEIFSSLIFSLFLHQNRFNSEWTDIRPILRTDATHRDASVLWDISKENVQSVIGAAFKLGLTTVTQGFIGSSIEGGATTLGREGSDYTAAILASMLKAESVTIWKDVDGLLNADPKRYKDTIKIDKITYNEVIEMAYYGAQIIHPKTIKPLQNAHIPLYVKCFTKRHASGTIITDEAENVTYPPLIIWKENQLLIQVTTRDFSFITEDNLSKIYRVFHVLKIKVNVMQNAAISFVACIDNNEEKIKELTRILNKDYKVLSNENVSLLTVRYHTPEYVADLTKKRKILLKQETRKTIQVVMK